MRNMCTVKICVLLGYLAGFFATFIFENVILRMLTCKVNVGPQGQSCGLGSFTKNGVVRILELMINNCMT